MQESLSDAILIVFGFIQSVVFFLMCSFFTKKAAFYLEEPKKIRNLLKYLLIGALILFLAMLIYQFFD